MPKNVTKPKIRTHVSQFTLRLDILTLSGRLSGVRKSKTEIEVETHFVTPNGNRVNRVWRDVATLEIFEEHELDRGVWSDDTGDATIVDADALKAVKKSDLLPNLLTMTVHDAVDVERYLFPSDNNAYLFEPDALSEQFNDLFVAALVQNPDKALLGMCNLRGHEGLYRVNVWRGHLIVQRQLYTTDINDHDIAAAPGLDPAIVTRFADIIESRTEVFDPERYRNVQVERLRLAIDTATKLQPTSAVIVPVATPVDLSTLLDQYFAVKP